MLFILGFTFKNQINFKVMIVTVEFFFGLLIVFLIGFAIAKVLERIFHVNLDESEKHDLNPRPGQKNINNILSGLVFLPMLI
jgi:hypothetical protein